ncbi:MAG TPA: ATP-binding cassette domain-containing protein [Amycolatopsis sp.]|nr:ATP-binding cassette domain-containing protein [Amycolatopsis sp.]
MNLLTNQATRVVVRNLVAPVVLVLIGLACSGDGYLIHLATAAGVAYILTAAFNLVYGYAGIFNLAMVMIYGTGAFTSVYLESQLGWSFWLALPVSVVVTAVVSILVALPTRRLSELFFAIQTLTFALALAEILLHWTAFSGGTTALYDITSPTFAGQELIGGYPGYYWLVAVLVLVVFEIMRRIHRSAMGRKLTALREGPRVLAAVGVSPSATRLVAFGISGLCAGMAGVLYAHFQLVIDLGSFSFDSLVTLLLAMILGGAGYLYGPVVGVLAVVAMSEVSLATSGAQDLVTGLGILVLVAFTRGGIAGAIDRGVRALVRRRARADAELPAAEEGAPPVVPELRVLAERRADAQPRRMEVTSLTVRFGGNTAVDDVSLSFATGEVIGLIGPNGAGKTTLLNAITGDVPVVAGGVRLDGDEILGKRPQDIVRMGLGRTFQSPRIIPDLTVLQNVMLASDELGKAGWLRQVLQTPAAVRDDRVSRSTARQVLADLAIASRADQLAGDQPYGIQRLVEIARNLVLGPAFLLLDEPGAGLTEFEREEVAATIRTLSTHEIGVVLVDHNLPLIRAACDRVYVLDTGRLIADGPPEAVFAESNVISAYLGVPG